MKNNEIDIAIIGGTGLYDVDEMQNKKQINITTPFGAPSDVITTGIIDGVKVAFIARHGRGHQYLPSEVPYKANIYATKKLGAKFIIAFSAVGSLKEKYAPTHFVIPDQLVDNTKNRDYTFFGNGVVVHGTFANPFCKCLGDAIYKQAKKLKIKTHRGGTLVAMEGPLFSTKAESNFHRKMGYDLVGMTASPEAKLAREAGIAYVAVSMVTDYDVWKEDDEVTAGKVMHTMKTNTQIAKHMIVQMMKPLLIKHTCSICNQSLQDMLNTDHKVINKSTMKKLKVILQ